MARILDEARQIGYGAARLDTLREMHDAIALYGAFGFKEVAPYRDGQPEGIRYFEKDLDERGVLGRLQRRRRDC